MTNSARVLPVALRLEGRPCLVVGAGPIGARKAQDLLDAGAVVTMVAPEVSEPARQLLERSASVTLLERPYRASDLEGVALVITATANPVLDQQIYDDACARGLWCNSADDPERCSFYLMALVRRDPVVVAITTGGTSPALASFLRRELSASLSSALGSLAELIGEIRVELHDEGRSTEDYSWSRALGVDVLELLEAGRTTEAEALLRARLVER